MFPPVINGANERARQPSDELVGCPGRSSLVGVADGRYNREGQKSSDSPPTRGAKH